MFIPKANRIAIYESLCKEGVMVAEKDFKVQHEQLKSIPNVQVIKTMQSLTSRGIVKEQYNWRHYYWCVTNEGVDFLRQYLHLPQEVVPATFMPRARDPHTRPRARTSDAKPRGEDDDRAAYRHGPPGANNTDKKGDIGPGSGQFHFRGGFGRGKPA
ncbi:40S ribosomal protein S10b-like [Drosophila subobscura]|uniref:40S ribosomal protein S10b-like n=1 Tax=Drosophila subobscura TaxID=7241 RepID=UPI00155B2398|nr:40S ribosomal protein S10b-like [Drosophila subobscura]